MTPCLAGKLKELCLLNISTLVFGHTVACYSLCAERVRSKMAPMLQSFMPFSYKPNRAYGLNKEIQNWTVVHVFDPSTQWAEAGGFLSSRTAWSTQRTLVSKTERKDSEFFTMTVWVVTTFS